MHQGKVRYIGASTVPAPAIVEAQWTARDRGLARFVTEQPPHSILVRGIEAEVLPTCAQFGMGVMTYSPLSGGWLSGRCAKRPISPAPRTAPIIGPRTMEHLESHVPAADVVSDEALLDRVDEIVAPGTNLNPADAGELDEPGPGANGAALRRCLTTVTWRRRFRRLGNGERRLRASDAVAEGRCAAVVLDLDGVLVDSRAAITSSINHALAANGHAQRPEGLLYRYIGPPLAVAFADLLGEAVDSLSVEACVAAYRRHYRHVYLTATVPVDGIREVLAELAAEYRLAVATSKPLAFAEPLLSALTWVHCSRPSADPLSQLARRRKRR